MKIKVLKIYVKSVLVIVVYIHWKKWSFYLNQLLEPYKIDEIVVWKQKLAMDDAYHSFFYFQSIVLKLFVQSNFEKIDDFVKIIAFCS